MDSTGQPELYIQTPTIHSIPMSKRAGFPVYLKLENLQVPGSFKQRGISNFCKKAVEKGATKLVCASGGNAGLAAAYSAKLLGISALIVLPKTTPQFTADRLRDMGATVEVQGSVWDESNQYALRVAADPDCAYVHPFDHPDVWDGHSTMMLEAARQMPCVPDVVVTSVGGGGLLNGVVEGLWKLGWNNVPVVAIETYGAECYSLAIKEGKLASLPAITSIAKSLGSLTVNATSLEYYGKHKIVNTCVQDRDTVNAILQFSDEHRMLVEPACGASLSAVYSDVISELQSQGRLGPVNSALIIVCGGANISMEVIQGWKKDFNL